MSDMSGNHICPACLERNLLEEFQISRCGRCSLMYCIHLASSIDPACCVSCLADVSLVKETITKTYEHYNEETDVVTMYKRRAKSIKLEGVDWLFQQRKISTMSDDSLDLAIEYHRALLNGLLAEREMRRIAHAHRFAGVAMPKSSTQSDGATTTSTTVKTTKKIQSTKPTATAAGIMAGLMSKGLTPQQILQMISSLQSTKTPFLTPK